MNRRFLLILPALIIALTACSTARPQPTAVASLPTFTPTAAPSATPTPTHTLTPSPSPTPTETPTPTPTPLHPLAIERMRQLDYPGSDSRHRADPLPRRQL